MKVGNPYGGLIYIALPKNLTIGNVDVTIENAVGAPYFVLGQTSEDDWINTISQRKAPWTELEVPGQINFVIPTVNISDIANVTSLMTYWKGAMEAATEFAGFEVSLSYLQSVSNVNMLLISELETTQIRTIRL